ncbi:MAG: hypothetical protein ACLPVY_15485 [Acidimicrobiia bacterium]
MLITNRARLCSAGTDHVRASVVLREQVICDEVASRLTLTVSRSKTGATHLTVSGKDVTSGARAFEFDVIGEYIAQIPIAETS